ncbi:hypothetical protein [Hymenobacter terricola]|uniref:hypothetical protein n=1 Tax=Hymenobacter terricola TaxID=2819236 RepID=UPI001B309918|nr:hypothetical protein [Hymenobacter terricola]
MRTARTFRRLFPFAVAMLLPAGPAVAGGCCASTDLATPAAEAPARRLTLAAAPATPWMFMSPVASHLPRQAGSRQFNYMVEHHLWLMGGVQMVPTGLLLTPETSAGDRTSFSQAGVGVGYTLSPTLRATSNWNTGLGRYNVSPGSQFTLGIAVRY